MLEAKLIGLKEGFKIAVVWLVFYSYLVQKDKKDLIRLFYAGVAAAFIISASLLLIPQVVIDRQALSNVIATSFAFLLIMSAAALIHASGTSLFGSAGKVDYFHYRNKRVAAGTVVLLLTVVFFVPDIIGSLLFLDELAFMRNAETMTYVYALTGFIIPFVIFFLIVRFYKPYRIGSYFNAPPAPALSCDS